MRAVAPPRRGRIRASDRNHLMTEDTVENQQSGGASNVEPLAGSSSLSSPGSTVPTSGSGEGLLTKVRRALALLVVVIVASGFVWTRTSDELRSCQTTIIRTDGTIPSVSNERECKPLPVADIIPLF